MYRRFHESFYTCGSPVTLPIYRTINCSTCGHCTLSVVVFFFFSNSFRSVFNFHIRSDNISYLMDLAVYIALLNKVIHFILSISDSTRFPLWRHITPVELLRVSAEELYQNLRGGSRFSVAASGSYLSPHFQPHNFFFYKYKPDFQIFLIYHYVEVIKSSAQLN